MHWLGLAQATAAEADMTVLNWYDEIYTFQISVDETPTTMQATLDTGLGYTVVETTGCSTCGPWRLNTALGQGGLTVSTTAVSGNLSYTAYSGVSGTATFCIYKSGAYSTKPTSANIASMPCIQTFGLHFANSVTSPNLKATAHLGMALAKGADRNGNTPASTFNLLDSYVTAGKLTAATKKFGLGLYTDDGTGGSSSTTRNFMNFGNTSTPSSVDSAKAAQTITFNDNEFYWKAPLNGIWFGTQENSKYGLNEASITLETGLQCLQIPSNQYSFVYEKLTAYSSGYWQTPAGNTLMDCGDKKVMKTISLLFNDKWVEILPTDYLVPLRTGSNGNEVSTGMCKLCIELSSDSDWHVGSTALMNYYAEFDANLRTLSLQPLAGSVKSSL